MSRRLYLLAAIGATAVVALAFHAVAQPPATQPPAAVPRGSAVIAEGPTATVVEETLDGKTLRTTVPRYPQANNFAPSAGSDGRPFLAVHGFVADAETQKLQAQEQAAAQEARDLAAQFAQTESESDRAEAKTKLKEKLAAIFDLQQQRRAREISQIDERLARLKETMKKRDASKDPIIDRRVEQLTGGVDELGWEETGGNPYAPHSGYGSPVPSPPGYPSVAPGRGLPNLPLTTPLLPAPVPVPAAR